MVRSITSRVRQRFNLSVAEVAGQGSWQRAVLGMTAVGSDGGVVRSVLDRAIDYVEGLHLAEIVASDVELLPLPLHGESGPVEE